MTVRDFLYTLISNDTELNALGYLPETSFANWAPDSPPGGRFWVLRWGVETVGVPAQRGRAKVTDRSATLWVYDKALDFTTINAAIKRWGELLDALEAKSTGSGPHDGWITQCNWDGDSDDAYDDVYTAQVRSSSYRIIASGD